MDWNTRYQFWIDNAPEHVVQEISSYSEEEKEFAFFENKKFGTAGIRGPIKYGPNHINEFVISKAAYAYGVWLIEKYGQQAHDYGVVIAHDNRRNRILFSETAAKTLSALGIPVKLFEKNELQPTPLLSYTVAKLKFVGGINITASHNPKNDNGFKVYDQNGKQLDSCDTSRIEEVQNEVQNIFAIEQNSDLVSEISNTIIDQYIKEIMFMIPFAHRSEDSRKDLKVTFSAQHGTSTKIAERLMKAMGVDYELVSEQCEADENFTHTSSPNPQAKESFDLAKQYAEKSGSEVLFATDPDADRFGLVIKHNGEWVHIDGNQLPAVQIWYKMMTINEIEDIKKDNFIVRSVVSSSIGDKIADHYGIKSYATLTGFKWIVREIFKHEADGNECMFAYEESFGSVVRSFTRDKDSFQALVQVIEMIYYYKKQGKTLVDVLEDVHEAVGHYNSDQIQVRFEGINGPTELNEFIDGYRSYKVGDELFGMKITEVADFSKGYKNFPKDNILFIYLNEDNFVALRPSGTEPILRIYIDVTADSCEESLSIIEKIKNEIKNS